MKIKIYLLLIILSTATGSISAQEEEELRLTTYYPAPFGIYADLRANFYRDFEDTPTDGINDPLTYFMDLDARSRMRRLAIGVAPAIVFGFEELNILGVADDYPMNRASSYAGLGEVSSDYIYSSLYGEAYNVSPTTVNNYLIGVYGKCTGTNSDNKGVYGRVGNQDLASYPDVLDFGVYGIGDEYGIRARGDICGAYAYFGREVIPQTSGIYAHTERNIASGPVGHGVYGKTTSSPPPNTSSNNWYYGGYFMSSNRGVYAFSEDEVGIYGETNSDDHYGGVFTGRNVGNLALDPGGGMRISVPQGSIKPEEWPEITGNDSILTVRLSDSLVAGGIDYGSRVTVIANGKDSIAGIAAKQNRDHFFYPSIYLKTIWPGGAEAAIKHILSSRAMEFKPGMDGDASHKWIDIIGDVYVGTSDTPVHYGDLAEVFELKNKEELEGGDVVVIDEEGNAFLKRSDKAYDEKVAGVISEGKGASMVMGVRKDGSQDKPIALRGRVLCNVDAGYGEIKPGDFLTTSPTPGHAMKAESIMEKDGHKIYGQGVVLGKALEPQKEGKGKILILVSLM